ncbi:prepilin peptidase, partial [Patescibacteria group bacterium]|nr:prepilin peptidase [Patescibacteria group bacterium]
MVWCFLFLAGLCVGSFVNVLVYRLNNNLNPLRGRSVCPNCRKKISWYDNIPIVSFLLLKGHCRKCNSLISWRYPLVELASGLVFVLIFVLNDFSLFYLLITPLFLAVFFSDLEYQIIPNSLLIAGLVAVFIKWISDYFFGFAHIGFSYWLSLLPNLFSALGGFLFFLSLHALTRGKGMGMGDVKLIFLLGLILGPRGLLVCLFLAFLTGALVGVILMISRKKKFKERIAFGPFLILAFF